MGEYSSERLVSLLKKEGANLFPKLKIKEVRRAGNYYSAKINVNAKTYLLKIFPCQYPFPSFLKSIQEKARSEKGNVVFLSTYFPPGSQRFLSENGFNFMDLSGNCYIDICLRTGNQKQSAHICVAGQKNKYPQRDVLKNVFSGKSSRIIRTILEIYPERLRPLELSRMCHVSPALVTKTAVSLEQEGYVSREKGEGIVVVEPALLLDRWADNYKFQNNFIERRLFINKPLKDILKSLAGNDSILVTRGAAASLLAPFADFDVIDVYRKDAAWFEGTEVARGENVRIWLPYDEGVLHFPGKADGINTVGVIQLYLDLYSDPKRGKEQAFFLREKLIWSGQRINQRT